MFLLDVSAPPVDADQRKDAMELFPGDAVLEELFPCERLQDGIPKSEGELAALGAREMPQVEDEIHLLDFHRFDAVFEEHLLPYGADTRSQEDRSAIEAERMNADDSAAAIEMLAEAVAIAAADQDGTIRRTLLEPVAVDFLDQAGLDELLRQHKLSMKVVHGFFSPVSC